MDPAHPPGAQPLGDRVGHRDRGAAEALGRQVQRAYRPRRRPALDLAVAEGVFGRDTPYPGQPRGDATVDAGAVQVGVHQVEAAGPDQAGQPGYRRQVPVAAHAEHVHRGTVGADRVGHRPGVGQRDHLALVRQPLEQQPQLVLGAADTETGDDMQDSHRDTTRCRIHLA